MNEVDFQEGNNKTVKSKYSTKIIMIAALLMIMGMFSFAFFSFIGSGNKNQTLSLKNGTMALRFADNDNGINATLHLGETVTKKFIIENAGSLESSLSLDWFNLVNTYQNESLTYTLTYSETEDGEYKEIVPKTNVPTSAVPITQSISSEISVPAGEIYYFNLNVTFNNLDVDQTGDIDAIFTTVFNVADPSKYRYYTLRVDPNGGTWNTFTGPQEYQLKNNETMDIPDPIRTGYTFDGWTLEGSSSELIGTVFNMGISDASLTANWTVKKVNVIVDGTTHEVDFGGTLDLGEPPEKEGHTFTGWEVTGPGTVNGNILTVTGTEDITITPTYTPNNYKYIVYHHQMNVDGNGYTLVNADTDEGEAAYNTTVNPPVKTYTGFTSPSVQPLTIGVETTYPPVKNKVEYNYDRNKYNVTFDINGTTTTEEMYYGSTKDLGTPEKTGYDFTNWSVTGGTVDGNIFTLTGENASATANFTPKTLSITFNANGGTTSTASKTVTYDSTYGELPEPTYERYEFLGWFTDQENGTQVTNDTVVNITANQTLYAHWEEVAFNAVTASISIQNNTIPKNVNLGNPTFANVATTDEGVYAMIDDYGPSYYYRGAVTNNYVKYGKWGKDFYFGYYGSSSDAEYKIYSSLEACQNASMYNKNCSLGISTGTDMWWRIIRVNGDGSLRIIYDGLQGYANGTANDARYAIVGQLWNTIYNDAKYAGWMFGGAQEETSTAKMYEGETKPDDGVVYAQSNETNTDAKTAVDNWYKENIVDTGYSVNIVDKVFCSDRSTPGESETGYTGDEGLGYGTHYTAFGTSARLGSSWSGASKKREPKFTCENKNDAFTVEETLTTNGDLTYPVGLITADDVSAAGGVFGIVNTSYYLYGSPNYCSWTFSPNGAGGGSSFTYTIDERGRISVGNVGATCVSSPVINLSAEYAITLIGDGSISNPYRDPSGT